MKQERNKSFAKQLAQAQAEGYIMMPTQYGGGGKGRESAAPTNEEVLNAKLASAFGDGMWEGSVRPQTAALTPANITSKSSTPKGIGTDGLGYMNWGADNKYPNTISFFTSLLPYTATAAKFNVDVAAGMGFVPKYQYSAISNGALVTKQIDYDTAGALLEQQLIDARLELMKFYQENGDITSSRHDDITNSRDNDMTTSRHNDLFSQLEQSYLSRIARAEEDLAKWEATKDGIKDFTSRNNLPLLALHLFNDMVMFDICFPELELSKQATEQPDNARWQPTITGITYRDAHTCRLEEMDKQGHINYIYNSSRWLDQASGAQELTEKDLVAIPAIDPEHPATSLEEKVRNFRTQNVGGSADNRPTRFICPSYYPAAGKPYYPQPSWHSIFGGDIFAYLATIVSDRAQRRKNKNILGYIIYVHQDYINKLIQQEQTKKMAANPNSKKGNSLTQQEQQQLVDNMWKTINTFISERDNAGKPLLAFTFTGSDGKDHDAYRIVEVPNATAKDAQAQKTELEEISGIIFFALQCHPELIGAVPGRTGAGGGTYQRELYLLKQLQMAPTQQLVLRVLDTITHFNKWDDHLVWTVKQQVLTTLDNSKTGLTESETK